MYMYYLDSTWLQNRHWGSTTTIIKNQIQGSIYGRLFDDSVSTTDYWTTATMRRKFFRRPPRFDENFFDDRPVSMKIFWRPPRFVENFFDDQEVSTTDVWTTDFSMSSTIGLKFFGQPAFWLIFLDNWPDWTKFFWPTSFLADQLFGRLTGSYAANDGLAMIIVQRQARSFLKS